MQMPKGFMTAKDRVTLLGTYNMNRYKEDLLSIGKSKSPRCFKNVKEFLMQYAFSVNT